MKVHDFLREIVDRLQRSPCQHVLARSDNLSLLPHENLAVILLALSSCGKPRPKDGRIILRPHSVGLDTDFTILLGDKKKFASELCITGDRLTIHLGKQQFSSLYHPDS